MTELLTRLKEDGNDVDGALKRFVGNESLYVKFLKSFTEDTNFASLKEAVSNDDLGNAFVAAHAFKSVLNNLGLTRLMELDSATVEKLRVRSSENLREDFSRIENEYKHIIELIKTFA